MPKILKPYTIIPQSLYVERDADRQIKSIIDDMGRPGYVLVSRQMGKTNLLLNAKRNLESPADVFVYIDLSNPFDSVKSCFENMIDTAIETNTRFDEIAKTINERRKELRDVPPHKQHTNELRLLLSAIPGKLVIILDEIDALTKTQYSDQIFAQIRSIYFSRVNFKELENLTYILSGVVEPNEIIKDPKISPFNIGQKIFLNDFNREEFEQLLSQSNLNIQNSIKERIFYWTNGNPRMTWDVCSEVENIGGDILVETIDKIVKELYLTTFDKPPVDNIRELVAKDREIRNSIIELDYKKGKEVSDKIKSKLYLSGIINYNENDIQIKNEIIRQSLNIDWIRSLEEDDKGLVRIALEQFERENYVSSLSTFERFLAENDFELTDTALCYYYMGYAAYRLSDFPKSIEYLNNAAFDIEEDEKWFYRVLNIKGLVYYNNAQIDESLACFKTIMESGRKDELYARALLNFTSIGLKSDKSIFMDEAKRIFEGIIDGTGFKNEKLKESFLRELKSIAHYNLGQIQSDSHEIDQAIKNYKNAIILGKDSTKPTIILALVKLIESPAEKLALLGGLIDLIDNGTIKPIENDPEKPIDFNFDHLRNIVVYTFINYKQTLFKRLLPHLKLISEKASGEILYDLAITSTEKTQSWETAISVLKGICSDFDEGDLDISKIIKYSTLKLLSYLTSAKESIDVHVQYIEQFSIEQVEPVDSFDIEIFVKVIIKLTEQKRYQEGLNYIKLIESYKSQIPEKSLLNFIVLYHLELNIYYYQNDRANAIKKASEILSMAENEKLKHYNSSLLGETGLEVIKQNAESILNPKATIQASIKSAKSYGRNDKVKVRYNDGIILETKFKRIEVDLNAGKCFILN